MARLARLDKYIFVYQFSFVHELLRGLQSFQQLPTLPNWAWMAMGFRGLRKHAAVSCRSSKNSLPDNKLRGFLDS
ncbi:hypothetical protein Y032_0067g122 [Ancylostoma ceylanicum]|uniref:Uncharacterized protein n=1 Tax=Ancylostoma ceylanicum TaxID=53326 RepID=A0A016TZA6_9BILA|nr:hypothetical protein Y032_0067g122 [Ancylostoma ceylanicum]